uniref:Cell growth-regulating nucleolar protein-like winged helix domain-containing protein n=1 Tax=Arundo donax TaxID=35708 RepID=A0A0A8XS57_ARUDO
MESQKTKQRRVRVLQMNQPMVVTLKVPVNKKIKWKKIITKALKTNSDGVMKLKKLQKLVTKELQECGLTEDKEGLRVTLLDKIASSSRFSVDGKRIRLVANNEKES